MSNDEKNLNEQTNSTNVKEDISNEQINNTNVNEDISSEQVNNTKTISKLIIIGTIIFVIILIIAGTTAVIAKQTCVFSHNWVAATCEKAKTCEKCGKTEGSPLGHQWTDATCETSKTCNRCGKTEGEPIGHNVKKWTIEKEATCLDEGKRSGLCSTCNRNVTEIIPATGHSLGQWEIGTKATLDSSGEKVQKCTKCGEIINKDIYYLTEEEKAEIIRQEREAKEAAAKAEKEAKEKAEKQRKASMYTITVLSAERQTDQYVRIYYRIKNNSDSDQSILQLRGTLYDRNGNGVASNTSIVYDLPANQSKEDNVLIQYSGNDYSTYDVKIK